MADGDGDGDVPKGDGDGDAVPGRDGEGLTSSGAGEKVENHWARGMTGTAIVTLPARTKCSTTKMCVPPLTDRMRRRRITRGAGPDRSTCCWPAPPRG